MSPIYSVLPQQSFPTEPSQVLGSLSANITNGSAEPWEQTEGKDIGPGSLVLPSPPSTQGLKNHSVCMDQREMVSWRDLLGKTKDEQQRGGLEVPHSPKLRPTRMDDGHGSTSASPKCLQACVRLTRLSLYSIILKAGMRR